MDRILISYFNSNNSFSFNISVICWNAHSYKADCLRYREDIHVAYICLACQIQKPQKTEHKGLERITLEIILIVQTFLALDITDVVAVQWN